MLGRNSTCKWISLVCALLLFLTPLELTAQQCEWPKNRDVGQYVYIDGVLYEYTSIEQSKARLKVVLQGMADKELLDLEIKRSDNLKEQIASKDSRIKLLEDSLSFSDSMVDKMLKHDSKKNLLSDGRFNYFLGLASAGGLFLFWKFAEKKFSLTGE